MVVTAPHVDLSSPSPRWPSPPIRVFIEKNTILIKHTDTQESLGSPHQPSRSFSFADLKDVEKKTDGPNPGRNTWGLAGWCSGLNGLFVCCVRDITCPTFAHEQKRTRNIQWPQSSLFSCRWLVSCCEGFTAQTIDRRKGGDFFFWWQTKHCKNRKEEDKAFQVKECIGHRQHNKKFGEWGQRQKSQSNQSQRNKPKWTTGENWGSKQKAKAKEKSWKCPRPFKREIEGTVGSCQNWRFFWQHSGCVQWRNNRFFGTKREK